MQFLFLPVGASKNALVKLEHVISDQGCKVDLIILL